MTALIKEIIRFVTLSIFGEDALCEEALNNDEKIMEEKSIEEEEEEKERKKEERRDFYGKILVGCLIAFVIYLIATHKPGGSDPADSIAIAETIRSVNAIQGNANSIWSNIPPVVEEAPLVDTDVLSKLLEDLHKTVSQKVFDSVKESVELAIEEGTNPVYGVKGVARLLQRFKYDLDPDFITNLPEFKKIMAKIIDILMKYFD